MRRKIPLILTLILIVLFAGCTSQTSPPLDYNPPNQNNHHTNYGGGGGGSNVHHEEPTNQTNESTPPVPPSITTVKLLPNTIDSFNGQSFTVTIYCEPSEPVRAFELTLSFDPFYLHAIDVTFGTFFEYFVAFQSPDITIDNQNGFVSKIYNLVIGPGNTTEPGSFVIVQFTSIFPGPTSIVINSIGLTNETRYIPVASEDCNVLII